MYKHILNLLLFLLVAGSSFPSIAMERTSIGCSQQEDVVPIELEQYEPNVPAGAPRNQVIPPLSACYVPSQGSVVLLFSRDCGYVSIVIENVTTGEYHAEMADSSDAVIAPISGCPGLWHLSITLDNGITYVGEFSI